MKKLFFPLASRVSFTVFAVIISLLLSFQLAFAESDFLSIGKDFIIFKDNADKTVVNVGIGTTNPTEKLEVAGKIKSKGVYEDKINITPTSGIGWYRIISLGGNTGGDVYVDANYDNKIQRLSFNYNIRSYIPDDDMLGSINVLRSFNYNVGPIQKIRIGADSETNNYNTYLDIYINSATAPTSLTVYGINGANFLSSPVYNPDTPTYTQEINLSDIKYRGLATSQNLQVGNDADIKGNIKSSGKLAVGGYAIDLNYDITSPGIYATKGEFGELCIGSGNGSDCKTSWSQIVGAGGGLTTESDPKIAEKNLDKITVKSNGQLTINSSAHDGLHLLSDTDTKNNYFSFYEPSGRKAFIGYGSATNDFWINNEQDGYMLFKTNGHKMMFTKTGNLGIGITNPNYALTVKGDDAKILVGENNSTGGALYLGNENHGVIRGGEDIGANDVTLYTGAAGINLATTGVPYGNPKTSDIKLKVLNSGNIGIGTTTPTEKLEVAGTIKAENFVKADGTEIGGSSFENIFESGGNVGIGTTNPTEKLEIGGAGNMALTGYIFHEKNSRSRYFNTDNSNFSEIYNPGIAGDLAFRDGSGETMRLVVGNVGIGTTTPKVKLDIAGGIALSIQTISENYTATNDDYIILCDATASAKTITLPDATAAKGVEINIKKKDASENICTVNTTSSQNIDGSTSQNIDDQYTNYSFISDGVQWWIK